MARPSDTQQFTPENIKGDGITDVLKKTMVATVVPMHKNFPVYFRQRRKTLDRGMASVAIKQLET